jgi:hypothetical protein
MLTRRELLSTAIAGSAAFVAGTSVAQAFTEQPMPPDVAADYLAGCSGARADSGHQQLMQKALAVLRGEIAGGAKPANAEAIVTCPICGCRMVVTASN